jgi:hypothetical protein
MKKTTAKNAPPRRRRIPAAGNSLPTKGRARATAKAEELPGDVTPLSEEEAQRQAAACGYRLDSGSSKQSQAIIWLQRPDGVLRSSLMRALGWQNHSVRGFIAGAVKKLGYRVESRKAGAADRVYRIVGGGRNR